MTKTQFLGTYFPSNQSFFDIFFSLMELVFLIILCCTNRTVQYLSLGRTDSDGLSPKIPFPFLWASTSLILVILRFSIASIILKINWSSNQKPSLGWPIRMHLCLKNLHWCPIYFSWLSWNWKFWNFFLVIFNFCFFFTFIGSY